MGNAKAQPKGKTPSKAEPAEPETTPDNGQEGYKAELVGAILAMAKAAETMPSANEAAVAAGIEAGVGLVVDKALDKAVEKAIDKRFEKQDAKLDKFLEGLPTAVAQSAAELMKGQADTVTEAFEAALAGEVAKGVLEATFGTEGINSAVVDPQELVDAALDRLAGIGFMVKIGDKVHEGKFTMKDGFTINKDELAPSLAEAQPGQWIQVTEADKRVADIETTDSWQLPSPKRPRQLTVTIGTTVAIFVAFKIGSAAVRAVRGKLAARSQAKAAATEIYNAEELETFETDLDNGQGGDVYNIDGVEVHARSQL
jgi:hypothetical protein